MIHIRNSKALARALASPIEDQIKRLLSVRRDQLGGDIKDQAHFTIVQPGDTANELEQTVGFSVFRNPADGSRLGESDFTPGWEWIEDHGFAYELCFIMDDSGFGHVVIVPNVDAVDGSLIELCATYAGQHA